MNILYLVKFYEPFDRGGSEWSTHDLAKLLIEKGHKVTVLTPNYGRESQEILDGIVVRRFPFFKKLKNPKGEITPWWTNNIIWFVYTSIICTVYTLKEKFDVIHVHSNEFLPAAVIAGAVTKKPTVATFRDYQVICNFGFCLWHKKKSCNLKEYLTGDFKFFYENYVQDKNPLKFSGLYFAALRSWLVTKILFYFAVQIKHKVAVSKQLRAIFKANSIADMRIIHNPVIVQASTKKPKYEITLAPQALKRLRSAGNEITYIGKFSKGKGVDLFMESIPPISHRFPNLKFKFVGAGVLANYLKEKTKTNKLQDRVIFTGRVDHKQAIKFAAESSLVVVPSIWPEPLPRSAIETILVGTPVVATNVGGISEVVKNNFYGLLSAPDKNSLKTTIIRAFEKRDIYRRNIAKDLETLKKHFSAESVKKYLALYQAK